MGPLRIENEVVTTRELLRMAKTLPGAWTGLKIAVLILIKNGWRPSELQETFGLSRQTMTRWVHEVNDAGIEAVVKTPPPGRPGQLTSEIKQQLIEDLDIGPREFGYSRKKWNAPTLVNHLKEHYGIEVKVRQARNYLKELGYRGKGNDISSLFNRQGNAEK